MTFLDFSKRVSARPAIVELVYVNADPLGDESDMPKWTVKDTYALLELLGLSSWEDPHKTVCVRVPCYLTGPTVSAHDKRLDNIGYSSDGIGICMRSGKGIYCTARADAWYRWFWEKMGKQVSTDTANVQTDIGFG